MFLAYEILGEYYEEVISRYTDLQFRHHFRMSRSTVEQLCLLLGNFPQVPSEFNYITGQPSIQLRKQISLARKSQFLCIEVTKIGEKWLVLLILQE